MVNPLGHRDPGPAAYDACPGARALRVFSMSISLLLSLLVRPWRGFLRGATVQFMTALALVLCAGAAGAGEDFLAPEKAFAFEGQRVDGQHLRLRFSVANGYYLYRERFAFEAKPATVRLGTPAFPAGKVKFDETFQKEVETYRGRSTSCCRSRRRHPSSSSR